MSPTHGSRCRLAFRTTLERWAAGPPCVLAAALVVALAGDLRATETGDRVLRLAQAEAGDETSARIRELLAQAEALVDERKLSRPEGDSALDRYREVLSLDPGNPRARIGIRQIAESYVQWSMESLDEGDLDQARAYLERARAVDPETVGLAEAADAIEARGAPGEPGAGAHPRFDVPARVPARPVLGSEAATSEPGQGATPLPDPDRLAPVALSFVDPMDSGGVGPQMMALPPGRQLLGPTVTGASATVVVPRFAIGKYEITVGQFRHFVDATGYRTSAENDGGCNYWLYGWRRQANRNWRSPGFVQDDDHPVVCISRDDAEAYAGWLSEETRQPYGLPSEAQWEYAARAATGGANYWEPLGIPACRFANVSDLTRAREHSLVTSDDNVFRCTDDHVTTAPVGEFTENDFELHDMLGNAGEWVADCWQADYEDLPEDGSARRGGDCEYGLARGGSWYELPASVSTTFRLRLRADQAFSHIGFRVSRQ